jgi:hypothetical protein
VASRTSPASRYRSALFLETVPLINSGRAVLLDDPDLLREPCGLERRRGASGLGRIDHRPGSHDDRANGAARSARVRGHARHGGGLGEQRGRLGLGGVAQLLLATFAGLPVGEHGGRLNSIPDEYGHAPFVSLHRPASGVHFCPRSI